MTAIALCAGQATAESDIWYSDTPADVELAKRACGRCLLRLSCLAGAIARGETWGVWGGEDMSQRAVDEVTREMADGFLEPADVGDVHGKRSTYVEGCRCDKCTAANTAGIAEWRANRVVTARENVDQQMQLTFEGISA